MRLRQLGMSATLTTYRARRCRSRLLRRYARERRGTARYCGWPFSFAAGDGGKRAVSCRRLSSEDREEGDGG